MQNYYIEASDMLYKVLAELKTPEEIGKFLEDICTIQEIESLFQRLDVATKLDGGMNYGEIIKKTGVSSATISRVNKCLKYGSGGYKIALDILNGTEAGEEAEK